jgi:sugar phosphate isomerase/epimerase
LFAFDNGLHGIADPAKTLKELGYAGMGASGFNVRPLIAQYQAQGLTVFSTYVPCHLNKAPAFDPRMKTLIEDLKGTDTMIWLTVLGGKAGQEDEKAAGIVDQIAAMAEPAGVRVALYPHTGFYVATTADALRVAGRVHRKNVGVSINLCHELMTDQGPRLAETVRLAMPRLFLVSINGADAKRPGMQWDRLIQPLGRGDFDVRGFLEMLRAAGYTGPVGLQCYAVKGDARLNLAESMRAWRSYKAGARNQ